MADRYWIRKRTKELHKAQGGQCHWCQAHCLLHDDPGYMRPKGGLSGKAATLDHLYSRFHPLRKQKSKGPRYVMACATCNFKRSKHECEVAFREEHLRRTHANVPPSRAIIYDYYPNENEPEFKP